MRSRRIIPGIALTAFALLLASAAPAASIDPKADTTGTVIAKVKYTDPYGNVMPLPGVEVFLWNNGSPMYGCTDAKGKVTFENVQSNVNLFSATGPGVSYLDCPNKYFLRPDDGKKMLLVVWDNHHGHGPYDTFQVGIGETMIIKFKVRTPDKQWKVCAAHLTTIKGSQDDDILYGTPGDDVINALGGNDIVYGGDGRDVICGGNGRDRLYGQGGDDFLFGENGKDRLYGGPGTDDVADGGDKADKCKSSENYVSCETIL